MSAQVIEDAAANGHSAVFEELRQAMNDPESVFEEVPLTQQIVVTMRSRRRQDVPALPDRIMAAPNTHLGLPVLSCDARIRASAVQTIW